MYVTVFSHCLAYLIYDQQNFAAKTESLEDEMFDFSVTNSRQRLLLLKFPNYVAISTEERLCKKFISEIVYNMKLFDILVGLREPSSPPRRIQTGYPLTLTGASDKLKAVRINRFILCSH